MEENFEEYKFTPKCFEKDLNQIFKYLKFNKKKKTLIKGNSNNRIYEINNKNSLAYLTSVNSNLSPGLILDKLKEYHDIKSWFPFIVSVNPLLRITQYCDIIEIEFAIPIFNFINIKNKIRIIRYWSYSPEEHSYFLMFKTFDERKFWDNIKKAGFIITIKNEEGYFDSNCELSFFIKFKKSAYSSLVDMLYKYACVEFCSSLPSFIGSVKMHKYNIDYNENIIENTDETETVDSYKYLIDYFTQLQIDLDSDDSNNNKKFFFRKNTELDLKNILLIKSYFEVKNIVSKKYGDNFFSENEIIRYVVGLNGNTNKILNCLDGLINFRKYFFHSSLNKSDEEIFQNDDYKKFISVLGLDELKRPVILIRPSYVNMIELDDEVLRFIVHIFNDAINLMTNGIDKYVVLIDFKNSNNLANIYNESNFVKKLFNIFNKFYVERLAEIYILNKGIFFSTIWKNISNLINSFGLMEKIILCNNNIDDLNNFLSTNLINLI